MSALFGGGGGGSRPAPQPLPPIPDPPEITDPAVEEAAERERRAARARRGRQSTLLTGSEGVTEAPPVGKSRLLGG